jgi:hypothetical protein
MGFVLRCFPNYKVLFIVFVCVGQVQGHGLRTTGFPGTTVQ